MEGRLVGTILNMIIQIIGEYEPTICLVEGTSTDSYCIVESVDCVHDLVEGRLLTAPQIM